METVIAKGGSINGAELEFLLTRNGKPEKIWMKVGVEPLMMEGRKYWCIALDDINDKKQAEKKLQESELKYRSLIENSSDAIFCVDEKGQYQFTNQLYASKFGKTPEYFIGKTFWDIYDKKQADYFFEISNKVFITAKSESIEVEDPLSDKAIYLWVTANPLKDEAGKVILNLVNITDVTKLKMTQLALKEAHLFHESIFNCVREGIIVYDRELRYKQWNRYMEEVSGIPSSEIIGKYPAVEFPYLEKEGVINNLKRALNGEYPDALDVQYQIIESGKKGWVSDKNVPLRDINGEIIGVIGTLYEITERKNIEIENIKAKERAEESESKYRELVENLATAIVICQDNIIVFANNEGLHLTGSENKEDLIGRSLLEFVDPDSHAIVSERMRKMQIEGAFLPPMERKFRRLDGNEINVEIKPMPIRFEDKPAVQLIISDITDRKKAESELIKAKERAEESESKYRELVENLPAAVIIYQDEKIVFVNKECLHLIGAQSREDLIGRAVIEFTHQDFHSIGRERMKIMQNGGIALNSIESKLIRLDGREINIDVKPISIRYDNKPAVQLIATDITDRKKAEEELRNYRDHLEQLVSERTDELQSITSEMQDLYDNAPCGYHSVNNQGIFVRINNTALKWLGYSREEVVNKMRIFDILTLETKELLNIIFTELMNKGEIQNVETEYVRKDGTTFFGSVNSTLIYDKDGGFLMSHSTIFDSSDRKRFEVELKKAMEEAENANKTKSEFLANMSHEIRTPMNAVLGYADLLAFSIENKTQKDYIESIKSSGKGLLTLINDILDLSKIEAGKLELDYNYINTAFFFSEFEKIFFMKVSEKNLNFILDVDPETPAGIYVDETRLRQIIFNLVGNAIKFTDKGFVKIKVFARNRLITNKPKGTNGEYIDLIIEVEDSGIGISEEFKKVIFDPFTQQVGQKRFGGTGLGLAISKRLVTLMNGTISLKSELNKGTVFQIVLPEVANLRDFEKEESDILINIEDIEFEPANIIIADDIESNRRYLIDALINTNIKITEAENGEIAYSLAKNIIPDLIITDIRMPKLDGFELLEKLKQDRKLKHIPVMAYTASAMKDQKEKILNSGFAALLIKPVQVNTLFLELSNHLSYKAKKAFQSEQEVLSIDHSKAIKDLPGLLNSLDTNYTEIWKTFSSQQPINEIEEFGKKLIGLGTEHNARFIIGYGEGLVNAAISFNIKTLLKLIKNYPNLIEELKDSKQK